MDIIDNIKPYLLFTDQHSEIKLIDAITRIHFSLGIVTSDEGHMLRWPKAQVSNK